MPIGRVFRRQSEVFCGRHDGFLINDGEAPSKPAEASPEGRGCHQALCCAAPAFRRVSLARVAIALGALIAGMAQHLADDYATVGRRYA